METDNEINVVFMPPHVTLILQPWIKALMKVLSVKNMFCKTIAAIDRISPDGSKVKSVGNPWKGFTILHVIKTHSRVRVKGQNITIKRSMEEVGFSLMDDFEGFKPSVEEVTEDLVEIAKGLESEMEPGDLTGLLPFHGIT